MINKKDIVQINGVYQSALYKDWYAAEYIVNKSGVYFRIRLPYKTHAAAEQMVKYLRGDVQNLPIPDWRPMVHTVDKMGHVR